MKRLLLALLISLNVFAHDLSTLKIVPYDSSNKETVINIAFEDLLKFASGSQVVTLGFMTEQQFSDENRKAMDGILSNPNCVTYVLLVEDTIVGFIEFNKMREPSIESMLKMMAAQGLPLCTEEQLAEAMPQLKKTDAECKDYALIECLAVSREWRGKGFGKLLLKDALEKIKERWPFLDEVRLTVNESNTVARTLYETLGFTPNPNQLPYLTMMKIVEYQKEL